MELSLPFYNDVWLDNAVQNFYNLLSEYEEEYDEINVCLNKFLLTINSNKNDFKDVLQDIMHDYKSNILIHEKDKKTGIIKEVKKDFIIIQEGKKVEGKVAFKEKIYAHPNEEAEKISNMISDDGQKICLFCGDNFKKKYDNLKQAVYPFVTKIKSLNGIRTFKDGIFYSFKDYYDDICPKCYLIGILEWLDKGIIYRSIPGNNTFLFMPKAENFEELNIFKKNYYSLLNNNNRYKNIKVNIKTNNPDDKTENTHGKFNTLLCFYEKFFQKTKTNSFVKEWEIIDIPWGSVKNVRLNYFNLSELIMDVIYHFSLNEDNGIYYILNQLYFFKSNTDGEPVDFDTTNKIKEQLSKSFLNDDFREFSKNFLPKKGGKLGFSKETWYNIKKIIYLWRLKSMGLSEENMKSVESAGNVMANVFDESNNLSILYRLDKSRSIKDFYGVLAEISKKLVNMEYEKKFKPKSLKELIKIINNNEDKWDELRDLLVIYASVQYSIISNINKNQNNKSGD
jgi:hypothetical protein